MVNAVVRDAVKAISSENNNYESGAQVNEAINALKDSSPLTHQFMKEKMEAALEHGVTLAYVSLIDPQGEIDRVKKYLLTDDVVGEPRANVESYIAGLEDWIVRSESI